jgi:hypothetical protein
VKLVLHFSGGGELIRWLSVPAVYNKNVTVLNFGSLKVDTFKLGGTFDFDKLDPLGITLTTASVYIFYGDQNPVEVPFDTLDEEQSWLHNLFGEPNSPVRIVLKINTSVGSFYSEIQKTLTGKLDSLEFETGMISAGTTINGVGVNSGYSYLFEPATSGDYGFTVSSSQPVNLSAVAVMGSAPNPKGSGIWGLSKGLYLITLTLTNPNQTFQFRVDPVTQATLKGTIDFTELLKPFDEGAVIGGVGVAVYADNSAHTPLAAPATVVFEDDTWKWSASFDLAGATPAVVVSGVTINGHSFYHQEYLAISGDKSDLTFTPKAITGSGPVLRTTTDQLLYVPAVTGLYSLKVSVAAGDVGLTLFDATKADPALANANGNGEAEIVKELTEGTPYRIGVSSAPSPLAYQFQAAVLAPVTLSGTVNFTGLAALPGGIKNTDIQVYNINGPSPVKLLEKPVAVNNGVWTVNLPPASNQNVMIVASVYLNNGLQINSQIDKAITRLGAKDLYLAPTTIASGEHGLTVYAGSEGTWLLWNPGVAGEYVLDAVRTPGKDAENPHLYLYNGLDGTQIADNDNSNGAFDSRIQRSDFVAGRPYLLRVTEAHGAGTFTVKVARAVSGTVNLAGLAPLTGDDISRTEIQVYTSSLAPLLGAPVTVESGAWTAILPYASTDQAVKVVASVLLKNNGRINSQIDTSLTGAKVNLAPAPTTSGVWHDRTVYDGNGTWLRWIPSITGEYVLDVEETDGFMAPYIAVYDADVDQLGGVIADDDNDGDLIQIKHLFVAEHPYLVMVKDAANKPGTFRFKAARSVSGTVNINGLAPAIVAADIDRTEIQVYNAGGSALGSPVKVENGAWTVIMPSTDQTVSIVASVYLKKGGQITASQIGVDLTTGATVPFAPAAITDDAWHAGTYAGSNGTWLLWVPAETAAYVLDAEKTGENNNTNPYMYLYDGSTGNLIVGDDNGGGNSNPRIQRNVEANHPYLVRVKDVGNGVGAFRFKAVVEP